MLHSFRVFARVASRHSASSRVASRVTHRVAFHAACLIDSRVATHVVPRSLWVGSTGRRPLNKHCSDQTGEALQQEPEAWETITEHISRLLEQVEPSHRCKLLV